MDTKYMYITAICLLLTYLHANHAEAQRIWKGFAVPKYGVEGSRK